MNEDINHITQAKTEIAQAACDAAKVIADAASEATSVLIQTAAEAAKRISIKDSDDHDLLVKLDTKMQDLKEDIKDLKDGTADRIGSLEREKNDIKDSYLVLYKTEVDKKLLDHGMKLTTLELAKTRQNVTVGIGIAVLSILVSLMFYHIIK